MAFSASYWIEKLQLIPHPEGGYYKEIYRDQNHLKLTNDFNGHRNFSTAIYYLLEKGDFSCFHRIKSDELWHHYEGGGLQIYYEDHGEIITLPLGKDLSKGQVPMQVVPKNKWFAAEPAEHTEYALMGCTVAPGFDFSDFEMASKSDFKNHPLKNFKLLNRLLKD